MLISNIDLDYLPINVAVYEKIDDDFVVVGLNKCAEKIEKISRDEILGRALSEVFPAVKEFGLFDVLNRVYETSQSEVFEAKYSKDDMVSGWRRNEVVKLSNGCVATFYTDESFEKELQEHDRMLEKELSKAEKLLVHQKNIFQYIMEQSDTLSVQGYNENHEVIYWNKASEIFYGYTKEEAYGKKLEDLIIPEFMQEAVSGFIDNWIENGVAIPASEITLQDKFGNDVSVYSQHVMIEVDTSHKEMYCIDINLKDMKDLENELAKQKKFLKTIINVIPDLIWLKDLDGKYLACNSRFEQFFGASEAEIVGKTDYDFMDEELATLFKDYDKTAIETGTSRSNDEYLVFNDGSYEGTFSTVKTPMKNENGDVIGVLGIAHDISRRIEREKELENYALYDTLTGLSNRVSFLNQLKILLKDRKHLKIQSALLFIDLDHFKEINDTIGHATGDLVLIEIAKRLKKITRADDILARLGGDEFVLVVKNISDIFIVKDIAQKIIDAIKEPIVIDISTFYVTTSIGISLSPDDSTEVGNLLSYADSAMYKAKANGRNSYEFYTKEMSERAFERVVLENSLRNAIKNQEFQLYYQPQVDALSGKTIGAEALIRWIHPNMGLISPAKFIPVAEDTGQILEIGKWVISQAMIDMCKMKKNGVDIATVSINLSVKQLNDINLIQIIKDALQETKCNPSWVEFEVTESYAMSNPENVIVLLNQIKELNCKLSLDDFGTGYSSLQYLKRFPIDKLKIDQSFVRDISGDMDDEAIVKAVILIAKSMQMEVIAEGVEDKYQKEFLLQHECNLIQGYFYCRPIPILEFIDYIVKNK